MAANAFAALAGAAMCVAASPYLARLVPTVPDRANRRWWRGAAPGRRRLLRTATTAAVLGTVAGLAAGWSATWPALVALALFAAPLIIIDVETHRLPDRLVLPSAIAGAVLLAVAASVRPDWPAYLRAAEGAAAIFAALFALTGTGSFGFGDVKLGAILGGYLGWVSWADVFYGIFAGFLVGTLVAIALLATGHASRKTAIPFGPALIVGALIVLALHPAAPSVSVLR